MVFHLSLTVENVGESRKFYQNVFSANVSDLDKFSSNVYVFGGYITLHEKKGDVPSDFAKSNFHFGAEVSLEDWFETKKHIENSGIKFIKVIDPGESKSGRGKLVIMDPSGYRVELNSSSILR